MLKSSKLLHFIAKATVTLVVLWLVFRNVNTSHWQDMLQKQDWHWLVMVIAIMTTQAFMVAWRWKMVLKIVAAGTPACLTFLESLKIYYMGLFFSSCLPGSIGGDAVRVWLTRSDHVPLTLSAHSVIIDRMLGLLAVCLLITAMLLPLGNMAGFNAVPWLLAIIAAGLAGLWLLFRIDRITQRWRHRHIIGSLLYFAGNLRLLFTRPALSLVLLAASVAIQLLYCICVYAIARSLGAPLNLLPCVILIPPVPLAAVLPVSIGGWGVREAGMVALLALAGVPKAAALMISIQMGLFTILVSLPGGLLWLAHKSHARHEVRLPQRS